MINVSLLKMTGFSEKMLKIGEHEQKLFQNKGNAHISSPKEYWG